MDGYSSTDFTKIFTWHLAALPGWTGYINHRTTYHSEWQQEYPITLEDYLAVRLWVAKKIDEIYPKTMILQHLIHIEATIHLVKSIKAGKRTCKSIRTDKYFNFKKKNAFQMLKWCFVLILDQS
jgi:uncharacterized protein YbcC (UPF0753/DUF2309 family)